jgi:hypothetical protein
MIRVPVPVAARFFNVGRPRFFSLGQVVVVVYVVLVKEALATRVVVNGIVTVTAGRMEPRESRSQLLSHNQRSKERENLS